MSVACALKRSLNSDKFFPIHKELDLVYGKRPLLLSPLEGDSGDTEKNGKSCFNGETNRGSDTSSVRPEKAKKEPTSSSSSATKRPIASAKSSPTVKKDVKIDREKKKFKMMLVPSNERSLAANNARSNTAVPYKLKDAPKLTLEQVKSAIVSECCFSSGSSQSTPMEDVLLMKKLRQLVQDDAFKNCNTFRQLLDVLKNEKFVSKEYLEKSKLFSLNEVTKICNDGWKKRESQLKIYFDQQLKQQLNEQHSAFLKFQQEALTDCGAVKPDYSSTPSYIS